MLLEEVSMRNAGISYVSVHSADLLLYMHVMAYVGKASLTAWLIGQDT